MVLHRVRGTGNICDHDVIFSRSAAGVKAGPFGLILMPGRSRIHGKFAVSAGIAPGAGRISSLFAVGLKTTRERTQLFSATRGWLVGSMPTKRDNAWSARCGLCGLTPTPTSPL